MSDPHYECDQCGACCKHLLIEVYQLDLMREPKLREVVRPFKQHGRVREALGPIVALLTAFKPCPLLSDGNLCTIYPTRPTDCVGFPAGGDQCQESRRLAGLPKLEATA